MNMSGNDKPVKGRSMVSEGGVMLAHQELVVHGGPIPCADELKKYEEVLPGAADRILTMAEKQSGHRRQLEDKVVTSNIKKSYAGQIFAFVVTMSVLIAGFILIYLDKDATGLWLILGDLAVLVSVFVGNRVSERKERGQKVSGKTQK